MKETDFIKQNLERWSAFEAEIKAAKFNPDKVAKHYIETLDDLSFARTHYKNRMVRSYLNGVTQILSLRIYKTQKGTVRGVMNFWKRDLPLVMYESRKALLISTLFFTLAIAIGVFSAHQDGEFVRQIMGDAYVDMTIENIEKGDPMAVYKDDDVGGMFLGITLNNTRIAAYTFVSGLLAGLGTVFVLLFNGIMLGCFQYLFFEHGVGFASMLTIWQHGTIEIFSIILAGAAGFTLAQGILFPGTYARIDAFRISGRKGLMMVLGIIPMLVYSGFIEAFITRLTDVHWTLRLLTILLSLAFVLAYYIWYPRRVAGRTNIAEALRISLQPLGKTLMTKKGISSNMSILGQVLTSFGKYRAINTLFAASVIAGATLALIKSNIIPFGSDAHYQQFLVFVDMLHTAGNTGLYYLNGVLVLGSILLAMWNYLRYDRPGASMGSLLQSMLSNLWLAILSAALIAALMTNGWLLLLLPFTFPLLAALITTRLDPQHKTAFVPQSMLHLRHGFLKGFLLSSGVIIAGAFALIMIQVLVLSYLQKIPLFIIPTSIETKEWFIQSTAAAIIFTGYCATFFTAWLGNFYNHYSLKEKAGANQLLDRIVESFPAESKTHENPHILRASKFKA